MAFLLILNLAIIGVRGDENKMSVLAIHEGHGPIEAMAMSSDGKILATGSEKEVGVWDIETRKQLRSWTLKGDGSAVISCAALSPSGKLLALAVRGSDTAIGLWRVDGTLVRALKGHAETATGAVFMGSDAQIATCGWDKTVRIWDAAAAQPIRSIPQTEKIACIAYDRKTNRLAWGSFEGTTTIWDAGKDVKIREMKVPGFIVSSIDFSPDGATLAIALRPKKWKRISYPFPFPPDFSTEAPRSEQPGQVDLWDLGNGDKLFTFHHPLAWAARFSPDGKTLATGGFDDTVRVWDVEKRKLKVEYDKFGKDAKFAGAMSDDKSPPKLGFVESLAFPSNDLLISGGAGTVGISLLWELVFWPLPKK